MTVQMLPGWYDDPDGSPNAERRWDGNNWTPERRKKTNPNVPPLHQQPGQAPSPYSPGPPPPEQEHGPHPYASVPATPPSAGSQYGYSVPQAPHRSLRDHWNGLATGVKAAVVIGVLLATFVIGGIVTTNRTQHSDSWYQGYENAETAKIMYNVGGISKREACRASLTAPPSLDHDDLIDGCIAALGG